jgi:hypothetical protein
MSIPRHGYLGCALLLTLVMACSKAHHPHGEGHAGHAEDHAGHASSAPAPASYTLQLDTAEPPEAGQPTNVVVTVRDDEGSPPVPLDLVHEKRFHVITVSDELDFFSHEHSNESEGRPFTVPVTFPRAGRYHVFVEFRPTGGELQLLRAALDVTGAVGKAPPLQPDDLSRLKRVEGFDVQVDHEGADLVFRISRDGQAVTLEPYLGALGHAVILSPGARDFVHSHPRSGSAVGEASFHVAFPRAGIYKAFAEFRPQGTHIVAEVVLNVAADAVAEDHAGHAH